MKGGYRQRSSRNIGHWPWWVSNISRTAGWARHPHLLHKLGHTTHRAFLLPHHTSPPTPGFADRLMNDCRNSSTPKLDMADPKYRGVMSPRWMASASKESPRTCKNAHVSEHPRMCAHIHLHAYTAWLPGVCGCSCTRTRTGTRRMMALCYTVAPCCVRARTGLMPIIERKWSRAHTCDHPGSCGISAKPPHPWPNSCRALHAS